MGNQEAEILLDKYRQGIATNDEVEILLSWVTHLEPKEQQKFPTVELERIKQEMWQNIKQHLPVSVKPSNWRLRIAAAALVFLVAGVFFYIKTTKHTRVSTAYQNDVPPGTNKATLHLTNGKTINLSNSKMGIVVDPTQFLYNDGSSIAGTAKSIAGDVTMITPRGGTYQLTLPDQTKVWLNAASTLKFPVSFKNSANRKVQLTGEAYFEVTKLNKPFIVVTAKQEVTVLGTHFNVNSYPDEPDIETTLLEGSVNVSSKHGTVTLIPGRQSLVTNSSIKVREADIPVTLAWKNDEFMFAAEPLYRIMNKISRWYNVDVIYKDKEVGRKPFSGGISKFKNVSQVLTLLEVTGEVKFQIEGRKVIVTK